MRQELKGAPGSVGGGPGLPLPIHPPACHSAIRPLDLAELHVPGSVLGLDTAELWGGGTR